MTGDALAEVNGVPQRVLKTPDRIAEARAGRTAGAELQGILAAAPAPNQAAEALETAVCSVAAPQ